MNPIKAMVRNGRIEIDQPLNLPDGSELLVLRSNGTVDDAEDGWDNTPEGIAAWLKWYDSLQPLIFTAEEQKALEEDKRARKEWELGNVILSRRCGDDLNSIC
jgi:hypothetical protein